MAVALALPVLFLALALPVLFVAHDAARSRRWLDDALNFVRPPSQRVSLLLLQLAAHEAPHSAFRRIGVTCPEDVGRSQ